jgi:hypothetical protein
MRFFRGITVTALFSAVPFQRFFPQCRFSHTFFAFCIRRPLRSLSPAHAQKACWPGVDVVITIFCDFRQFRANKLAFFSKTNGMINFLHNLALFWVKNAKFFAELMAHALVPIKCKVSLVRTYIHRLSPNLLRQNIRRGFWTRAYWAIVYFGYFGWRFQK